MQREIYILNIGGIYISRTFKMKIYSLKLCVWSYFSQKS